MNTLLLLSFGLVCEFATAASLPRSSYNWPVLSKYAPEERIIDGVDAKRHQFPYMVSIQTVLENSTKHRCGASILSPRWVVSAAHCFYNYDEVYIGVAGLLNMGEDHPHVQAIPVDKVVWHPKYEDADSYDISVLHLQSSFSFNDAVKPVSLPRPNEEHSGKVWVSGWGHISMKPDVYPTTLQCLEMSIASDKECNDIFSKIQDSYSYKIGDTTMCTLPLATGHSTCHEDSGGPLVQEGVLVGIVHGGDPLCGINNTKSLPNVFAKVSVLLDFVKQHVIVQ